MRKKMEVRRLEVIQRQKPGTIAGFGGTSHYDPAKGAGASSFQYWEEDTYIQKHTAVL